MNEFGFGRIITSFIALFTVVSPFWADFNSTHIFNPNWPPHAKFHNAQTMVFCALLGSIALYFLWLYKRDKIQSIRMGFLFTALYWVAQAPAILFPGTAFVDPEFIQTVPKIGNFSMNQSIMDFVFVGILALAYQLEKRKIIKHGSVSI
jgi:hypothetical protein